uniref:Uncharacterized protein n=1 Tax=Pongo abelii TaxID=9601 RepID=H2PRL9_PONAB
MPPFSWWPCRLRRSHFRQELMKLQPRSSLEQMIRKCLFPLHGMKVPLFHFQVRQASMQRAAGSRGLDGRQSLESSLRGPCHLGGFI